MNVKTVVKNYLQQKCLNMFCYGSECLPYRYLKAKEIGTVYTVVKILWKSFVHA